MNVTSSVKYLLVILATALVVAPATAVAGQLYFDDVPPESTFFEEIQWMAANGVTQGCDDRLYCPEETVTRQQMAAFMFRLAESGAVDAGRLGGLQAGLYAPSGFASTVVTDAIDVNGGNTELAEVSISAPACADGSAPEQTYHVQATGNINNMQDGESATVAIWHGGDLLDGTILEHWDTNSMFVTQAIVQTAVSQPIFKAWAFEDDGEVWQASDVTITAQVVDRTC